MTYELFYRAQQVILDGINPPHRMAGKQDFFLLIVFYPVNPVRKIQIPIQINYQFF
jgi:hypothetical protein